MLGIVVGTAEGALDGSEVGVVDGMVEGAEDGTAEGGGVGVVSTTAKMDTQVGRQFMNNAME